MYKEIWSELEGASVITGKAQLHKEFERIGSGAVYELHDNERRIVVKVDSVQHVKHATNFLNQYAGNLLLQQLIYVAQNKSFFVYNYVRGSDYSKQKVENKDIKKIVKFLINDYIQVKEKRWGSSEKPQSSLAKYLTEEVISRADVVDNQLESSESNNLIQLIKDIFEDFSGKPYLTHGDLGVHNVLIEDDEVCGVIDPEVAYSLPAQELAFLIASKPNDFSENEIIDLFEELKQKDGFSKKNFMSLYQINLYIRIANCLWYHPEDLESYLNMYKNLLSSKI